MDGNRSIDDSFYRRPAWRRCRAAFIKHRVSLDGGMCQRCGEQLGRIVHHRIHLTREMVDDPAIAYGFDNLELVCLDCHNIEHGITHRSIGVRYAFDPEGNPMPTPPFERA